MMEPSRSYFFLQRCVNCFNHVSLASHTYSVCLPPSLAPSPLPPHRPPLQSTWLSPRRWLNLQEYQSKKLMQESGVAVQRFYVADTASEALEAAKRLSE